MDGFPAADDGGLCAGRAAADECDGGRREPHAGEGWTVSFETTEGGALAMQLRGTEGETVDLGATQVDAGSGQLVWDGVLPTEARRRTAFTRSRFSCATTVAKRAKKACCR